MVRLTVRVPERRKMRAAVGAAALFVVASAFVLSTPVTHSSAPVTASGPAPSGFVSVSGTSTTSASSASSTSSTSSSSSATGQVVSPTGTATAAAKPAATITHGPPNPPDQGIRVIATPRADMSLSITETAFFTVPQHSLTLSPPVASRAGAVGEGFRPEAQQVQLSADGRARVVSPSTISAPRKVTFGGAGVKLVELRYILRGALTQATGGPSATPARAIVQTLFSGATQQLKVSYVVSSGVTTFECPELSDASQAACRSGQGSSVAFLGGLPADHSLLVFTLGDPPTPDPASSPSSSSSAPGTSTGGPADPPPATVDPPATTGTTAPTAPPTDEPTDAPTVTSSPSETAPSSPLPTEPEPTDPPAETTTSPPPAESIPESPPETTPPAAQIPAAQVIGAESAHQGPQGSTDTSTATTPATRTTKGH